MSSNPDWFLKMFAALDTAGVPGLYPWLHEDVRFRFAGYPPGRGAQAFAAAWESMAGPVASLAHEIDQIWELGDEAICRGQVRYHLHDGRIVQAPFANFFQLRDGRISEYLIYVDASAVFGPAPDQ